MTIFDENIMTLFYYPSFLTLLLLEHLMNNYRVKGINDKEYIYKMSNYWGGCALLLAVYFLLRGIGNSYYMRAVLLWGGLALCVSWIGKRFEYIPLGVSLSIFLSEWYEIPIYLGRLTRGIFHSSSSLVTITPKLFFIVFVWFQMKKIGIDFNKFARELIVYSVFYMSIGFWMYTAFLDGRFGYLLKDIFILGRVSFILFTIIFIYRNKPCKEGCVEA